MAVLTRIREVKWPWTDENQFGFVSPLRVTSMRLNAKFLNMMFIDNDRTGSSLRMYFEEQQEDAVGKDRFFRIFHAHDVHFSDEYDGCDYLASAPIHGNQWVAHVYTIRPAALGSVLNRIQSGQSAERLSRLARGRKA